MTFLEAAHVVLLEKGNPMHIKQIITEVHERKLWRSNARPQWIENSLYGTLIKACQAGDSRFERLDDGPFFMGRKIAM